MLTQDALEKVGSFDPVLGNVDADADLWMRFAACGLSPVRCPSVPSILYRTHAGQTSAQGEAMERGMALSRLRMMLQLHTRGVLQTLVHENRSLLAAAAAHRRHTVFPISTQYLITRTERCPETRWMRYDLQRRGLWLEDSDLAVWVSRARASAESRVFVRSSERWVLGG
jgi:hypothetical protein